MVGFALLQEDCVVGDIFRDGDSLGCVSTGKTRQAGPTARSRDVGTWML